ncbi:MAG TPA: AMP-binding protein [Thermoanaerobaculia bacterium]|nr:AMP-binding protein [Thermoanaerobaculia bacterium]
MNLHDLWAIPLTRRPDAVALDFSTGDGERSTLTYRALFAAAGHLAGRLAERGVGRGDRVALHLGNRPETAVAYLAALRMGAVAVPVNLAYREPEIAHLLADAEPSLALTEADRRAEMDEAARVAGVAVVTAEEMVSLDGEEPPGDRPPLAGSDLALLLYTSGTTGRSKGAMLTHDNLLATVTGLLAAWQWSEDDRLLLTLPIFHTHGLVVGLFTALAAGARVLLRPRFDATAVADAVTGEAAGDTPSPTLFFGVPTMYVRLADELARRRDAGEPHAAPGMRLFASGSAPLAPETFELMRQLTGHEILERYGMTETGMNLSNLYAGPRRPGTVGVPLPGVSARIVGDDGEVLAAGSEGELQVAGGNVFAGYWRAPEKTAESFVTDAAGKRWFRTGDLARRDPESGYHTLLGRRTELILSGGYNVYPREVEETILGWPGVREAAVAGLPDRDLGEAVAAWVVVDGELDEEAVGAFLAERLARYKLPRRWFVVDGLPRNALGKVQKGRLTGRG